MTPARDVPAQHGPPDDLTGFPEHRTPASTVLHRAHLARRGPWWFSSGGGRFDLSAPRGTCYLASSAAAAVRERLGPVLSSRAAVPSSTLDGVVVSRLAVGVPGDPRELRWANLRVAAAAEHGVTRELESMTPYDVPSRWARAFDAAGLDGVRYGPRFSPGSASAHALFGDAGEDARRVPDPEPTPAAEVAGVPAVVEVPRRRDLKVIAPPGRGRPR
ncbi:RES domain-containing protein [Angustibacter peucedani]